MTTVKEKAYAKINLFLDVIGLRNDGFHDIKTVMHSVCLADVLTVTSVKSNSLSIKVSVEGSKYVPEDGRNLAYMAANLFCEYLGIKSDIQINIKKNIPVSAGLAGGSTDAAATLRALNRIFKKPLSLKALAALGAKIGSDVPYCVLGKTAVCEGRGEMITPLEFKEKLNVVIAVADERVSTPAAYKRLDEVYSDFDGSIPTGGEDYFNEIISAIGKGERIDRGLFNIFEVPVFGFCPKAAYIKSKLLEMGAGGSIMSGSGPSVFGIFESEALAKKACDQLILEGYRAFLTVSA